MPELVNRITALTSTGDLVVLSGHSHGSVLLTAAVLQLPPTARRRVALLTYGSPLHRLYGRLVPAYQGEDVLREMGRRLDWRWTNLWRDTNPIGGWVFCAHQPDDRCPESDPACDVDRRLKDPRSVRVPPLESTYPPIRGHWPCESDSRFVEAVGDLIRRLQRRG